MKIIFLGLITVLLISGCVVPGFDFFSGGDVEVKELPPDVISVHNITVLPSTSVRVGDQFSVYFEVLNQDEFEEIPLDYNLYDTGLCRPIDGDPEVSPTDTTGSFVDTFSPKESRLIEWNFEAPTGEEIAYISVTCPIRFKFDFYDYTAESQVDFVVIDKDYLLELQRAGETVTSRPTVNVGRGPIKIYFEFGANLPVKNGSPLPVYVRVEDKGTGLLRKIENGTFTITFPTGFTVPTNACPYFNCFGNVCTSNEDIPIINKKSLEIRCSNIKTPESDDLSFRPGPEKTYSISAEIEYDYSAVGEINIKVNP
ncbi:MAG: hypothetical protein ABIE55_00150 [Candidatus Aenigmatarchaeota archaeon]